jgi:phospholipid/cholesterol/gamma-HCH transport system substrate-binding protein
VVKIQLVVFLLLSFFGVVYTGFTYVGIRGIGPLQFAPGPYTIKMELTDSGGIYSGAPVTYRGVQVGKVGTLRLAPIENPNGVEADLEIDHDTKIPTDTLGQVANLSAVGEQYVNLSPQTDDGPYFRTDGKTKGVQTATYTIPTSRTSIPVDNATLLKNLDNTVNSVNRQNLATVISELGKATDGTGPDLQKLIDSGNALLTSAQAALPQTLKLIDDGKTVLNTQQAVSANFQSFAHNLNLLSQQLVTSDPDLRKLLDNGVVSAQTLQSLLQDNEKTLPTFFSNLVTLGQIQQVRLPGLQTILVLYPLLAADTPTALDATDGSGLATAQFAATLTSSPNSCDNKTNPNSGYQSTTRRTENPATGGFGGPANLNTLCLAPDQAPTANQQTPKGNGTTDYRGSATFPRPAGDNTGTQGGSIGTKADPNTPNYFFSPYSASNGSYSVNGSQYRVGTAGNQTALLGTNALSWLLVSSTSD